MSAERVTHCSISYLILNGGRKTNEWKSYDLPSRLPPTRAPTADHGNPTRYYIASRCETGRDSRTSSSECYLFCLCCDWRSAISQWGDMDFSIDRSRGGL